MLFRCPHDLSELEPTATGVACPLGHTFDRAREGYLHLLRTGRKAPRRPPGDTDEMLRARRRFLERGHYEPVRDAVVAQVRAAADAAVPGGPVDVLDAGCGEGWYIGQVADALPRARCWGVDVAKTGVRLAARRYPAVGFAVASSHHLPVADGTVGAVLTVFAPRPFAEFARVLVPGGAVVVASPGPDHLAGLTAALYGEARPHEERAHAAGPGEGPAPGPQQRVRYRLELTDAGAVADLLAMTPYWWRASPEQRRTVTDAGRLATTVDVVVTTHPV